MSEEKNVNFGLLANARDHASDGVSQRPTGYLWRSRVCLVAMTILAIGGLGFIAGWFASKRHYIHQVDTVYPPQWPLQFHMDQELVSNTPVDSGHAWYDWTIRSWRAEHSNMWNSQCRATLIWIPNSIYMVFHDAMTIGNITCCMLRQFNISQIHPPDWLSSHIHVGSNRVTVDGIPDTLVDVWYSTTMASTYYHDVGRNRGYRWDNTPEVSKLSLQHTLTQVFYNWTVGSFDQSVFAIPASCALAPACPPVNTWSCIRT